MHVARARGWLPRERAMLGGVALSLSVLYFGFFNHDFSVDGLRYASQVEAGGPLFHPNHLLPNALFWLAWRAVTGLGIEVRAIWVAQSLNALVGIGTALCLARALAARTGVAAAGALALLYALGFAAWTFAQEPEVYVLPSLAVTASLALLWRVPSIGWGRLIGVMTLAILAVLCLQQYVFWYPALLALLWRYDLGSDRRAKWWTTVLVIPLVCLAAYLAIGWQQWQLGDVSHAVSWFFGYAWDVQHGFGTYRAAPEFSRRALGLLFGLANLALPYEVLMSPWALAAGMMGLSVLVALLWRARAAFRRAAPFRADACIITLWMSANLVFAFWWESRDIEFLLPVWLAGIVVLGSAQSGWRLPIFTALVLGSVNLSMAFAPQREWPQRYRVALELAQKVSFRESDVLITDELNTIGYLNYFHGVKVRFLPGAISAAMHAAQPVPQARAGLDQALVGGARVFTTELDERGRLYRIAEWLAPIGRPGYEGGIDNDVREFYRGLHLLPGPVPGTRQVVKQP
jgi:hypothetical protein